MQDRFKFRAWDKTKNNYIYDVQEGVFSDISGMPISFFEDFLDDEFYTVEQCTGLKDKDGKLIYEGDIVKYQLFYDGELIGNYFAKISYNKGFFEHFNHVFGSRSIFCSVEHIEVVGNIHENPELMGEQK